MDAQCAHMLTNHIISERQLWLWYSSESKVAVPIEGLSELYFWRLGAIAFRGEKKKQNKKCPTCWFACWRLWHFLCMRLPELFFVLCFVRSFNWIQRHERMRSERCDPISTCSFESIGIEHRTQLNWLFLCFPINVCRILHRMKWTYECMAKVKHLACCVVYSNF